MSERRDRRADASQRRSAVEEFFVADRDVNWVLGSASLTATQVSAGTFVGTVGIHYAVGVSFIAIWPGIWLGWLASMLYVAPQLRRFGGVTVPEFVAARFDADGANGRRVRALVAALVAAIYLVYTAAQYVAGGVVLETVLGVPDYVGIAALAALALSYTLAGGMRASVRTDAVQVVVMVSGLVAAVALGLARVGGPAALYERAVAADPALFGWGMSPVDILGFALAFGLGVTVAPYEVSRVYAMESPETVSRAIRGSVAIQAVIAVCVAALGLVARVRYPSLATPDAALPTLAQSLLGPVAGGLLLLAVLAAVISTIDSVLLVSSSALAYDLYAGVVRSGEGNDRDAGGADVLAAVRLSTVVAAVVPVALALRPGLIGGLVQVIVALYSALVAGALFAPVVLGLHWDGATTGGGVAGVVVGCAAVVGWHVLTAVAGAVAPPLSLVPPVAAGVAASALAVVVGSSVSLPTEARPGDSDA
ncbi:sodium:solute symporter family protein [Halosimplex marinum]|uniref:sodium:solute symporter family protein n=1 Tax=Halosimplex marinum TaxID=3396620 RepID=UPI003F575498